MHLRQNTMLATHKLEPRLVPDMGTDLSLSVADGYTCDDVIVVYNWAATGLMPVSRGNRWVAHNDTFKIILPLCSTVNAQNKQCCMVL